VIQKNGKEVARLISRDSTVNFLTDSIRGVLKKDYDDKKLRMEKRQYSCNYAAGIFENNRIISVFFLRKNFFTPIIYLKKIRF